MPVLNAQANHAVGESDVRVALERMAASEAFRGSPQLVAFLRYVVEATLRGQADRIKGYTIATEALGRTVDFDPQADPIVRVEATRLRRALTRYHASATGADGVQIDLPLGSYVPVFRRVAANVILPMAAAKPLPSASPGWRRIFRRPRPNWRHAAVSIALVLIGACGYAGLGFFFDLNEPPPPPIAMASAAPSSPPFTSLGESAAYPVVFVGSFAAIGEANAEVANALRAKLRDALARFDDINVINGAAADDERMRVAAGPATPSHYGLTASLERHDDRLSVSVRLTDVSNGRVAFARTFQQTQRAGAGDPAGETIVREIAAALAQPYGVIHSRERIHQMNSLVSDRGYRCLLQSYEYWRTFEPEQHARARDCLERAIEADPGFAAAYTSLAELILQEFRRGLNVRAGDAPPLERALRAARRAVELRPGSARGYQALMDVYFLQGEYALTLAAGEKAVTLNPYNPNTLACYGARLISLGEVEKGARVLKEAVADIVVRPPWIDFYLFLAAYLTDDRNAAGTYAGQIMSDKFAIGFAARALVAAQRGETESARQLLERMVAIHPGWREDPRRELKKLFPADAVTDRLARDLARAGLSATN